MRLLELQRSHDLAELERLCQRAGDPRTRQRLQAICLRAQGKTPQEIAQLLRCAPKTVRTWIKWFNAGGAELLQYRHTGGRTGKLTPEQENGLRQCLLGVQPDGRRWTLKALANWLFEEYGVRLSQQQVSERVKRFGLRAALSKSVARRPRRRRRALD